MSKFFCVVGLMFVLLSPAHAKPTYRFVPLPNGALFGLDITNNEHVLAGLGGLNGYGIFDGHTWNYFNITDSSVVSMNDNDRAVGFGNGLAFTYEHGIITYLPGNFPRAFDINNAGQVVGGTRNPPLAPTSAPCTWINGNQSILLPDNVIREASAELISNSGTIVGWGEYNDWVSLGIWFGPVVWRNGLATPILGMYRPDCVNNRGDVTGVSTDGVHACAYFGDTLKTLSLPENFLPVTKTLIDDSRRVYGQSGLPGQPSGITWEGTRVYRLDDCLLNLSGARVTFIDTINSRGVLLVRAFTQDWEGLALLYPVKSIGDKTLPH